MRPYGSGYRLLEVPKEFVRSETGRNIPLEHANASGPNGCLSSNCCSPPAAGEGEASAGRPRLQADFFGPFGVPLMRSCRKEDGFQGAERAHRVRGRRAPKLDAALP